MTKSIYIFKCEHDTYYIGKTSNLDKRVEQHYNGTGSSWTSLHRPIKIIETIDNCDKFDEDKYTLKYMELYGIDNVRGGMYSEVILSLDKINLIKSQLNSANDCCFQCGESNHFIRNCPYKIIYQNDGLIKSFGELLIKLSEWLWGKDKIKKRKGNCYRCGRNNHTIYECYARYHLNGKVI